MNFSILRNKTLNLFHINESYIFLFQAFWPFFDWHGDILINIFSNFWLIRSYFGQKFYFNSILRSFPVQEDLTSLSLIEMTKFSHFWSIFDRRGHISVKMSNFYNPQFISSLMRYNFAFFIKMTEFGQFSTDFRWKISYFGKNYQFIIIFSSFPA